jgi:hypothetical protein
MSILITIGSNTRMKVKKDLLLIGCQAVQVGSDSIHHPDALSTRTHQNFLLPLSFDGWLRRCHRSSRQDAEALLLHSAPDMSESITFAYWWNVLVGEWTSQICPCNFKSKQLTFH